MRITIFGANEIGCLLATEFFEDHDVTVIDREENRVEDFNKLDISFVYGNASNISTLTSAQIEETDLFIACSNLDEANIVACMTVKKISHAFCVCFVSNHEYVDSLLVLKGNEYKTGLLIDSVIWPEELLTQEIFRIITVPNAIDVENFAQGKARMLEYRIKEESQILNKKVKECVFPEQTLIVGITRDSTLFIPDGDTTLMLNDKVIFMGTHSSLDVLASLIFKANEKVKCVTIIGGGSIGLMLAKQLEQIGVKVKIIEKNYKRAEQLTEELKKALILSGDGTNIELLKEEEIEECDVLVSVTNNDEKNLLCSLLAKQLGVNKVITRVSNTANVALFEKVGIDVAVSSKSAAIKEIRNGFIETDCQILATVESGQGEIIEIEVPERLNDNMIMDLHLPVKAIIAFIQRGNTVIIPKGNTQIKAADDLVVFTTKENSIKVKDFFKD